MNLTIALMNGYNDITLYILSGSYKTIANKHKTYKEYF